MFAKILCFALVSVVLVQADAVHRRERGLFDFGTNLLGKNDAPTNPPPKPETPDNLEQADVPEIEKQPSGWGISSVVGKARGVVGGVKDSVKQRIVDVKDSVQQRALDSANFVKDNVIAKAFRTIAIEVLGLTPEQYDAIAKFVSTSASGGMTFLSCARSFTLTTLKLAKNAQKLVCVI